MHGRELHQYHVFLASPGDVTVERDLVRRYFDNLNRTTGLRLRAQFQVVDWENFSTAGVGRPQELITRQTLERFRASLILVIVVMAQRFGTPSGAAESGTEEEVRWALASNAELGFPEVKFFFRSIDRFAADSEDPEEIGQALEQWRRVREFRRHIETERSAYVRTYSGPDTFESVLREDLDTWVQAEGRPWTMAPLEVPDEPGDQRPPSGYFQRLVRSYQSLDIAGIDSDKAFKLPLDEIYVRLRVISSDDSETGDPAGDVAALTYPGGPRALPAARDRRGPGKRQVHVPAVHRAHPRPVRPVG